MAKGVRERHGLRMAEAWLDAGGWTDGQTWTQGDRSLTDELDEAPVERGACRHVADGATDAAYGTGWTFPDGSGVVRVGPPAGAIVGARFTSPVWDV